jgi:hypothetical protein
LFTNHSRVRRVKTRAANLVGRLFVFEDPFIKPCYFGKIGLRMCRGATRYISKPKAKSRTLTLILKHITRTTNISLARAWFQQRKSPIPLCATI